MTEQPPSYPPPPPDGYGSVPPPGGYGSAPQPPPGDYGYPPPPQPGDYGYPPPPQATGTNGWAIASLVCSVFGWLCVIGGILGIIFGFLALGQIRQTGQKGRGMAIAGIVIGAIVTAIVIVAAILGAVSGGLKTTSGAPAVVITVEQQPVLAALT